MAAMGQQLTAIPATWAPRLPDAHSLARINPHYHGLPGAGSRNRHILQSSHTRAAHGRQARRTRLAPAGGGQTPAALDVARAGPVTISTRHSGGRGHYMGTPSRITGRRLTAAPS